jgi:hypothetical protein
VVGVRGQPLADMSIGQHYLPRSDAFTINSAWSDASGAFSFRVARISGHAPATGPDTVSLWVVGADLSTAGVKTPALVRDSVLVHATVSPVGAIPVPTTVRLQLPAP